MVDLVLENCRVIISGEILEDITIGVSDGKFVFISQKDIGKEIDTLITNVYKEIHNDVASQNKIGKILKFSFRGDESCG